MEQLAGPDQYRPPAARNAKTNIRSPNTASTPAHSSTPPFKGRIRVRRYRCLACRRTVSLLWNKTLQSGIVALPARPVPAPPFPLPSRSAVRRPGRVEQARTRARLRSSRTHHAPIGAGKSTARARVHRGAAFSMFTSIPARRSTCCARLPWPWIWLRRTFEAIWCGRSPTPSCV